MPSNVIDAEVVEEAPGPGWVPEHRLATRPDPAPITLYPDSDPAALVATAMAQARVLQNVIEEQHLYSVMGNDYKLKGNHPCKHGHKACAKEKDGTCSERRHINIEGWTLLGNMVGVFAITVDTRAVPDHEGVWQTPKVSTSWVQGDDGKNQKVTTREREGRGGWQATVEARTRSGDTVARAVAEVRWEESNWGDRDSYALLSMAQTRASSKALRMALDFVARLAGFTGTPAEEMPGAAPAHVPRMVEVAPATAEAGAVVVDMGGYLAAAAGDPGNQVVAAAKRLAYVQAGRNAEVAKVMFDHAMAEAVGDMPPDELDQDELLTALVHLITGGKAAKAD